MSNAIESLVLNLVLTEQVAQSTKTIKQLTYHLKRCKTLKDKAKITAMIVCCVKVIESSIVLIVENLKETKDSLVKPICND